MGVSLHLTVSWRELYPFLIAEGFSFRKSLFFVCYFLVWFGLETPSRFVAQAGLELTVDDAQAASGSVSHLASAFALLELQS